MGVICIQVVTEAIKDEIAKRRCEYDSLKIPRTQILKGKRYLQRRLSIPGDAISPKLK